MGYHKRKILKGVLGKASKIREELEELEDAVEQGNKILVACELSDLYGALSHMAKAEGLGMEDLRIMSEATERAFKDGSRGEQTTSKVESTASKALTKCSYCLHDTDGDCYACNRFGRPEWTRDHGSAWFDAVYHGYGIDVNIYGDGHVYAKDGSILYKVERKTSLPEDLTREEEDAKRRVIAFVRQRISSEGT